MFLNCGVEERQTERSLKTAVSWTSSSQVMTSWQTEDLASKKATLNVPPFRQEGCSQLSAREVEETRRKARVRIHVERVIGQAKNVNIINEIMPITLVPMADDLVRVCFYLVNFDKPLMSD